MFAGWGSWVARFRWPVLTVALVAVISAGVWGLGVFGQLSEGGYNDPHSESTLAKDAVQKAFGPQGGDLVVIYTPRTGKIDDAALGKRVRDNLAKLPKSAVTASTSYWSTKSPQLAAADKSSAVALLTLAGADDGAKLDAFREIDDKLAVEGAAVQLSGATVLADASASRSTKDLGRAEAISLPIVLILLVLIFGSLVAASLPVLVGGAAVLGSLGILHAVASAHEVNSFAVNVASLLGLGMAIDYGLFMVGRFREEQAEGRTPEEAVARTVATAGRTVVFSATLLMIALAGLLLFPQGFLKSLAYGGLAAVFLAALLSLTLLPALLAILGKRVDKLPVRLPRLTRREGENGWTRLAGFVLRRPLLVAVPILGILLLLAAPISSVHFGEADERTLPAGEPARQAIETLKADYPQFAGNGVQIVLRDAKDTAAFAVALRQVPGIAQIGTARKAEGVAVFTATLKTKDAFSSEARGVVEEIRALPVPAGAQLLVGGTTARNVDSVAATADRLPLMVGLLGGATLLLMFLAFGSILLPIKAVLMSALSLSATFGALVWIFQEGHGSGLLGVTPAPLEVGIVVLMAAVVFGLSTDYEVFLLSRMVEARTRGASTAEAVTTGLARTGRVISAAAILLIVVTGAFALSAVTTMRFVGVGMIIALLLDATVVRLLLVPAVMKLLGDAAWWAPGPLRRLQERAGLAEYAGEQPSTDAASGRHAAEETAVIGYATPGADTTYALPAAEEAWALPAAPQPYALPAGQADETQVFSRFEETAILQLPEAFVPDGDPEAHKDAEEVEAEILPSDELSARSAVSDDETYEAEIVDTADDPAPVSGTTYVSEAAGRYVPDPSAEPEPVIPADLSEWLPAVPDYETPAASSSDDEGYFFGSGSGALALTSGLDAFDRPWEPAVFDESAIRPGRDAFFPETQPPPATEPTAEEPQHADEPQPADEAPPLVAEEPLPADEAPPLVDEVPPPAEVPPLVEEVPPPAEEPPAEEPAVEPLAVEAEAEPEPEPERGPEPEPGTGATVDLSARLARSRAETADQSPTWSPINATLGEMPLPRRTIPSPPEPEPMTPEPEAPAPEAARTPEPAPTTALVRRPVNLADHLRESRPADLSEYTTAPARAPRTRRPVEEKPAERRPATLADHLSARPGDATRDLRAHADQE